VAKVAKVKTLYVCTECGGQAPKWQGQCPACGAWNTLVESVAESPSAHRFQALAKTSPVQRLSEIEASDVPRFTTGIGEFDRVLGGGLVAGGVVLIGGDPGIGKSTLLLQSLAEIARERPALYISGEESGAQLTRIAKQTGTTIIMVGHVTKEGNLAGPRVLEHIVDTVLYFEGDTHSSFRLVRAFKNRFGAVNELGVFAMTERGLRGVANPSALFLSHHEQSVPGTCVLVTQEGSRPLLVEVQALVDTAHVPNPRRLAVGLEQNRLALLLAVLHRHAGIACFDQDVFLNAVGGVKITEPAADLAVLLAIHSSMRNKALPKGLIVFGEVGLAGEIRPSPRGQDRLKEAAKLGFSIALIPKANAPKQPIDGLEVIAVDRIEEAIDRVRSLA
jgi:DNA repair protein RadA/Sms